MRVDSLRIRNFRCFGERDNGDWALLLRPKPSLNLLVGPNGSGKTAILDALDILLNPDGRSNQALISEYEFHDCNTQNTLSIEVTLTQIDQVLADFESDIQWIDPSDGILVEEKGTGLDSKKHQRALVVRFEAALDGVTGAIEWNWLLPKFPATSVEPRKELGKSQHQALGYYRIRPSVSAGAFTLGRYSPLGRQLRKLDYRLGRLPAILRGESTPPKCSLVNPDCGNCEDKAACLPGTETAEEKESSQPTLGAFLAGVAARAQTLIGAESWSEMVPALGPRYGGLSSSLAGLTMGVRPKRYANEFIPFERLSDGEKYALSFALARSQIPGDLTPVIVMEEPETALYPSGVAALIRDIQATPTGEAPQVFLSSHSESVLRCALPGDVFVVSGAHAVRNLQGVLETTGSKSKDPLSRAEYLLMPGGPSVLLAEKVLVVEGAGDAIVSGYLDRLAATNASRASGEHMSFASQGWCVFPANNAGAIPDVVRVLLSLGKRVAGLFDADDSGKRGAEKTAGVCPTFVYKSATWNQPCIEEALLAGLGNAGQRKVISEFHDPAPCQACSLRTAQKGQCWSVGLKCDMADGKDERKSRLQVLCLEEYEETGGFPKAFQELVRVIETAIPGVVSELDADG
jgi:energy-coupling factor transporter ATP-binding protein EcfA2